MKIFQCIALACVTTLSFGIATAQASETANETSPSDAISGTYAIGGFAGFGIAFPSSVEQIVISYDTEQKLYRVAFVSGDSELGSMFLRLSDAQPRCPNCYFLESADFDLTIKGDIVGIKRFDFLEHFSNETAVYAVRD